MMYLSKIDKSELIIAVALEPDFMAILDRVKHAHSGLDLPYRVEAMRLKYPVDGVRLIYGVDEVLTDKKVYADWERGNEDPLHYYGFHVHDFEPKEDFWRETKPDSVCLWFDGHSAGFDVTRVQIGRSVETFHGYGFSLDDWRGFLKCRH